MSGTRNAGADSPCDMPYGMNKAATIRAALLSRGFVQLDSTGSTYTTYRNGDTNVDLGPRGATTCWVACTGNNSCVSHVVSLMSVLLRFAPRL